MQLVAPTSRSAHTGRKPGATPSPSCWIYPPLPLADLWRQSISSRRAGYEDVNDAERLALCLLAYNLGNLWRLATRRECSR